MRTIKFRAQKTTNEIWVYGSLVYSNDLDAAIYYQVGNGSVKSMEWVYVKPDTIGQFTGLYDKNGKEIYEGDIVEVTSLRYGYEDFMKRMLCEIVYDNDFCCFNFLASDSERCMLATIPVAEIEVIGNIHNNKGLIRK